MGEGWEKFSFPSSKRAEIAADRSLTWLGFFFLCNLEDVTWSKLNVS